MNAGKVVPHCTGMNILTKLETQHLKKTYSLTFMMERKVAGLKGMSDFSTINVVLRDIQSLYYSFSDIFIVLRKEFLYSLFHVSGLHVHLDVDLRHFPFVKRYLERFEKESLVNEKFNNEEILFVL